jgi:ABC-type multidrug transport system fused ATPase/permease subunit
MSLAQLAVFMYVLIRLVPEVHSVNRTRFNIVGFINHFHEAMNFIQSAKQHTSITSGSRSLDGLVQGIRLENISFGYGEGISVLEKVNVFLEAGKLTAIIGPSGTGKSTLLDLLVRLVEPRSGKVLLDGTDVKEFDLISLRAGISLVSQDILHFNDTVLENIRYGRPDATEEEIKQAATEANAHNFIQALPQGYQTLLGPRGMTISGGERQRIALARALLQNPFVLLLDEVTSNLDAESEHLIQESVFRAAQNRTIVVVTHRLSTIEKADKIIVLDQGRVVEEGSPQALASINGLFSRHLEIQVGGARPDKAD